MRQFFNQVKYSKSQFAIGKIDSNSAALIFRAAPGLYGTKIAAYSGTTPMITAMISMAMLTAQYTGMLNFI